MCDSALCSNTHIGITTAISTVNTVSTEHHRCSCKTWFLGTVLHPEFLRPRKCIGPDPHKPSLQEFITQRKNLGLRHLSADAPKLSTGLCSWNLPLLCGAAGWTEEVWGSHCWAAGKAQVSQACSGGSCPAQTLINDTKGPCGEHLQSPRLHTPRFMRA